MGVDDIPDTHPRRDSLIQRERILEGIEAGLVHSMGAVAHGRGEAFDYLLGETTPASAKTAITAAAAYLVEAERPVISVNGNTAVLVAEDLVRLASALNCPLEINIFHRSDERVETLVTHLEKTAIELKLEPMPQVLGREPDGIIPGLDSNRARCCKDGIGNADVVLVPLEDGDRAEALVNMGKAVLTVDLNPMSRTARSATVTIVDNLIRAAPYLLTEVKILAEQESPGEVLRGFDNLTNLNFIYSEIYIRLEKLKIGEAWNFDR